MSKQERNPKRSPAELMRANSERMRQNELGRAAIHIRSAQFEAKLQDFASAAANLQQAAEIYQRASEHAGETVEIDAE